MITKQKWEYGFGLRTIEGEVSEREPVSRDAEPEPEPEPLEPTHFGRSRSRSRRNGLLGARAGAGAVKNGAAPAPKRDTIVARKEKQQQNKKKPQS